MKYVIAAFALFLFSTQAEAAPQYWYPQVICYEDGACWSDNQIKQVAKSAIQDRANCGPPVGTNCELTQGVYSEIHVTVRSSGWTPRFGVSWHFKFTAKNQTVPSNPGHFVIFSNEKLTFLDWDHGVCQLP